MSSIQKLVYNLETGALRVWMVRGALAVMVVGLGVYYSVTQYNGFSSAEAMDLAQIGRQVAEGRGYSTKFVRPIILKKHANLLQETKSAKRPMPELVQPPAYPTVLAALFTVASPEFEPPANAFQGGLKSYQPELYVLVMNIALLLAAGLVFYWWMARMFDQRVAVFATVLFLGSDLMWSLTISGMPMQWMILLVCGMGCCVNEALLADETLEGEWLAALWLGVAGLLAGTLVLTRYSMLAVWLPFAALGWLGFTRRITCGLVATLVPLAVFAPWLARNAMLSGNLFGYAWVQLFAGDSSLWRVYGGETHLIVGFNQLVRGMLNGLGTELSRLDAFYGSALIPAFFLLGLFHVFKRDNARIGHWFWAGAFLLLLVFNAAVIKGGNVLEQQDLNSLFALYPAMVGLGAAFVMVLVERLPLPSKILRLPVLILVGLLQIYPLGLRLIQHRPAPVAYPPYIPQLMLTAYKQFLAPDEMQASDIPWAGAWYCDRLTLWMPQNREDFDKLNETVYPISACFFTAASMNKGVRGGEYAGWAALIEQMDVVMHLGGHYGKQERAALQKAMGESLLHTLNEEKPLPYQWFYPVFGTDYYYYFSNKRQVQGLWEQMWQQRR